MGDLAAAALGKEDHAKSRADEIHGCGRTGAVKGLHALQIGLVELPRLCERQGGMAPVKQPRPQILFQAACSLLPEGFLLQPVKFCHTLIHRSAFHELPYNQACISPLLDLHARVGAKNIDILLYLFIQWL